MSHDPTNADRASSARASTDTKQGTIDANSSVDRPPSLAPPASSDTAAKVRWAIFIAVIVVSMILLSVLIALQITGWSRR